MTQRARAGRGRTVSEKFQGMLKAVGEVLPDTKYQRWSDELVEKVGVEPDKLTDSINWIRAGSGEGGRQLS